jgi:hypothetical protein
MSRTDRGNPSKGESESLSMSETARGNPSKGESKSISMSNVGRFVAIRGTGSNAPASTGGRDVRPAWPCAEDAQEEEEEPREEEVSKAEGNAPQQRVDPFPFLHLASLRASAQGSKPTPLLYLSAHVRCPSGNKLLTQCLVDPIGS